MAAQNAPPLHSVFSNRRKEDLEWFYDFLDQETNDYENIEVEEFSLVVKKAIELGIEATEFCDEFSVNKSTIHRWESAKNAPQPFARPIVINWIKHRTGELLSNIETNM